MLPDKGNKHFNEKPKKQTKKNKTKEWNARNNARKILKAHENSSAKNFALIYEIKKRLASGRKLFVTCLKHMKSLIHNNRSFKRVNDPTPLYLG